MTMSHAWLFSSILLPNSPCTHIVDTLAPKYQYRDYFKATVYYYLGTWTLSVSIVESCYHE